MNKAPVGHSKRTNSRSVLGKSHACGASEALRSSSVVACRIALVDWSLISKKGTRSGEVPRVPHPSRARQVGVISRTCRKGSADVTRLDA